ncbi:MAG: PKD domain-containing protein, partial [Thermoplasmata archaeon]
WGVEFGDFLIQDTTPPRIQNTVAVPPVQDSGGNVRIETQVTDNYDAFPNIAVALEVFDPFSASMFNISMSYDSIGGVYYYERAYSELGFYDFIITAKDRNDNYATDSSTFEIQDMTPPTIGAPVETPDPQEVYGKVNVSVDVTDNYRVQSVSIDIYDPSGGSVGNFSMVYDPGSDRYSYESGYDMLGSYTCVIWAFDTSSNFDSVGCGFRIQDSTKPTIENATAEPLPQNIGGEVNISANAYDNFLLLGVYIRIWDPASNYLGNFSMDFDASSGRYYFATVYNVVGTYDFKIDAVDSSSNWASTPGTFIIEDMVPPEISNVIAVPTPQEVGLNVEISARITDNEGVIASATVEVRDPSLTVLGNFSMSFVGLDKYSFSRAYDLMLGRYNFTIWASDSNDNWASATGFFDIEDTTPPTINITPVPPVEIEDGVIIILATIGDNFYDSSDLQVWINISYPNGTPFQIDVVMDYDPVSDEFSYQNSFNVILGDYPFDICASDSSGNLNCEQGSFRIQDTQPPVASAGGDQTVDQGDSVSFDGTGTYDNDPLFEETGNYSWTFEDQGTVTLYGKSPSYTFTVGGDYVVTLKARDRSGNLGTDTVLIHVNPGPNPPINIQISDPTEDSLKLTWEPPSTYTDGTTLLEPDIQRYTIYRSNSSDGEYVQIADGITTTEYVDTGLSNNTTYYYKITCWANNIESEKSDWRLGTTLPPMPPPEPGEPLSLNMTLLLLVLTLIIVVVVVAVIAAVLLKRKKRPPEEEIYLPEAYGEAYAEEGYPPPPPPR